MIRRDNVPFDKRALHRSYTAGVLKVCPVCDTLNLEDAKECFVCCWFGNFESDPDIVKSRLVSLVAESPELIGLLNEPQKPFGRFGNALRSVWHILSAKLDVWV